MSAVIDEALRIWKTVPRSDWGQALLELPERKLVFGRIWPYRAAVREVLVIAWADLKTGGFVVRNGFSGEARRDAKPNS